MTVIDLPNDQELLLKWKREVLARDNNTCVNCDRARHTAACFIVPPEVGGRIRPSNGVTVCRDCRILAEGSRVLPQRIDNKTAINFLISPMLHKSVEEYAGKSNFGNISSLVRHMISAFITSPELFDDISLYQDDGSSIKINGWVDGNSYDVFKRMCGERNISFTDCFKALLMMAVDSGVSPNKQGV